MSRFGAPVVALLLALLPAAAPAQAQSDDPHEAIFELAAIEADHEICGFALSDEQQDVIAQRRDALVTRGDVSEAEVAATREQVTTALRRQREDGLCRPDGAEERLYKRRLTGLGLL